MRRALYYGCSRDELIDLCVEKDKIISKLAAAEAFYVDPNQQQLPFPYPEKEVKS